MANTRKPHHFLTLYSAALSTPPLTTHNSQVHQQLATYN